VQRRTCIGCRKRQHKTSMIPLGLSPGGSLILDPKTATSRAWICARQPCFERVSERPSTLSRAFKQRVALPEDWMIQMALVQADRLKPLLLRAHRSGQVITGREQVIDQLPALIGVLFSEDAGEGSRAKVSNSNSPPLRLTIPLNTAQIGQLLRCGPRSVLGLRPGRMTQSLLTSLQGWDRLG
jgi:predicted RNA-binding protein YlxR (DUF448 family)